MKRRSLLAGLGAGAVGLSGCLGISPSTAGTPTSTDSEATDPQFQNRTVRLVTINREPREHNVALTGEMRESEVTAEHTATLRLTFANEGDSESMNVAGVRDDMPVIAEDFTHSAPQEYLLVPPRYAQPDRKESCWEVPHEGAFNGDNAGGDPLQLSPDESVSQEYLLWDRKPDTSCMSTGDYHFGSEWANEGEPFKWMITLSIQEP